MIYFIRCQDYVKIGTTTGDVRLRVQQLQMCNPYPLELIATMEGGREIEQQIHALFVHRHKRGEWYHYGAGIVDYIDQYATRTPKHNRRPPQRRYGKMTPEMLSAMTQRFDI